MAVRRLAAEQPAHFAFSAENQAWADALIGNYPDGRQASAIIPMLWRAQEQCGGWLPEPAIRTVCDQLGMAYIRGLEIATFYTMFQLSPVGRRAHIQVCGTTPCMLRGSLGLIEVCKTRIAEQQHQLSADGTLSWEEVECLGNCANAPMVQIDKDTFEDLTPTSLELIIDGALEGALPPPGSQIGRKASCPEGGPTTLTDSSLYDGSTVGAWRKRFSDTGAEAVVDQSSSPVTDKAPVAAAAGVSSSGTGKAAASATAPGPYAGPHPAALAAMANAGLVKELETRGVSKPLSADELSALKTVSSTRAPGSTTPAVSSATMSPGGVAPEQLSEPRGGAPDDLALIWGVAEKLADKMNAMGIWHFDQIAKWTPANVDWFEAQLDGFKGRIERDKWIEQCQKLATGWRPDTDVGERPKGV